MEAIFKNTDPLNWRKFIERLVMIGLIFIVVSTLISGINKFEDFYLAIGLNIFLILVFLLQGMRDKTTISICSDIESSKLLVSTQHRRKGYNTLTFNTNTLSLKELLVPWGRGPMIKALDITDAIHQWQITENDEGIGKENFTLIVSQLKQLYPNAWPPPKQWRRVV